MNEIFENYYFEGIYKTQIEESICQLKDSWKEHLKNRTIYYQRIEKEKIDSEELDVQFDFYVDRKLCTRGYPIFLTRVDSDGNLILPMDLLSYSQFEENMWVIGNGEFFSIRYDSPNDITKILMGI